MAFVWVLIGIVYIIYKLHKEEHVFTKDLILPGIIFVAVIVITSILNHIIEAAEDPAVSLTALLLLVVPIGIAVLIIIIGLVWNAIDESKPFVAKKTEFFPVRYYSHDDIDALKHKFAQNGYSHIETYDIADLIFCGPLKTSNQKYLYIDECVDWISEHATTKMEKMSAQDLQSQIGVPLCIVPQYPYEIKGGYTKRKEYAHIIGFLLHKQDLKYRSFGGKAPFNDSEFKQYCQTLSRFISQYKEDYADKFVSEITVSPKDKNAALLRLKFKNYAYGDIDISVISDLISSPESPLNNEVNHNPSYNSCYNWMCSHASSEMDELTKEELGEKIGFSIDYIPLDSKSTCLGAETDRLIYVKNYLLNKKGLKYRRPSYGISPNYAQFIKDFIETKNKEISQKTTV